MTQHTVDFQTLFEALPGNFLVLQPDAPDFTILAISDELLLSTATQRQHVVGKSVFEVFPENPEAVTATGPSSFRISLRNVLQYKTYDQMPVIRYDVPNADGVFEERYWSASSKPVLTATGEVAYIIHTNVDVTERVKAEKQQSAFRKIEKTYNLFMQAPVAVCIVSGPENIVELANDEILRFLGRKEDIIGKPFFESHPEAVEQGFPELLDKVRKTGEPFYATEYPATLIIDGKEQLRYYNFVYSPYYENPSDKTPTGVFSVAHDVTEQVIARKKLEESEQKFRNVLEQAADPILIFKGEELVLEVANEALFELWQVGPEALNKPFLETLPEMKGQGFVDLLHKVLRTGEPFYGYEVPAVFKRKSGREETLYFNFSYQPYREADGTITGVLVLVTDVTERVAIKQQLVESEARFRNMVQQSPVAFTLTRGHDIVIESINAPMLKLMGKSHAEEDVIGKKMIEVLPEIIDQPILDIVSSVMDSGEPFRGNEVPVMLMAGEKPEEHYFNISYTPLIEDGVITGVLHVAIEVTEQVQARKKLEESREALKRFKFMADNARDPFILMQEDGCFAYLNQKALEAWGYTETEAKNIRVPDVDPIYQDEKFYEIFAKAQREFIPQFETLHERKDGHIFPVEVNMGGLTLDGKPYLFAVARDITERKRLEEAMKVKNEQLQRINDDLDNFVYTASHDLKAPISNIEGLLQALLRTLPVESMQSERAQRITTMMQESVERFKKTIASLTEVVKLQKENSTEAVLVDISEVIREVSLDLEPIIRESGAQLEVDVGDCHPIRFSVKNLRSVVYNLLSNAIKYRSPLRLPRVEIRCRTTPEYHVLIVRDNGLGMEAGQSDQLFTMFKRFHDHVEGSGIGLYMIKKMIESAGGKIQVDSQVGIGTTFRVDFQH